MDSRVVEWRKSGILPSDVPGLSLAEREMFVTKDNVWGYELWNEWQKKGVKGEDLYYIYKVKQILPDRISRSRVEVQQGELYYLYEDYVKQVAEIKMYLLEQANKGTLNYSTWLKDLYIAKGWAHEIESVYGNRVEYDMDAISWEEVVTPELERFVNSFARPDTVKAFQIEYYCQGFPARNSEGVMNPRVNIDENSTGVVNVEIAVSDYTYKGVHASKAAFIDWLRTGGFTKLYYKNREEFLAVDYVEDKQQGADSALNVDMQEGNKLCVIKQYRLTPNNVKVYKVENNKGNSIEMSEGAIRDWVQEGRIVVHGLDIGANGELQWIRAPQLIR